MKILHVKSLRTITLAAGICVLGFLLAYLSGGLIGEEPQNQPSTSLPTVDLEVGSPSVPEESEENSEEETPAEEIPEEQPKNTAANYYVRLNRGLSSSAEELLLEQPSQLKTSLEYRGKNTTEILRDEAESAKSSPCSVERNVCQRIQKSSPHPPPMM